MNKRNIIYSFLLVFLIFCVFLLCQRLARCKPLTFTKTKIHTVVKYDTIRIYNYLPIHTFVTDTIYLKDTVLLKETKVYKDTLYRATISGINATLDSLEIYSPKVTQTVTVGKGKKINKLNWGLQTGIGLTPKGLQPFLGVGICWKW